MGAIAFIPARGGSKSIPLKNIKPLAGRPLVWWTLHSLQNAKSVDRIVVATDSPQISQCVRSFDFSKVEIYERQAENARDHSSTESVMMEYLERNQLPAEQVFILAQATSPFTRSIDFDNAYGRLTSQDCDSLLSAVRTKRFFWSPTGESLNYDHRQRPRRQEFEGSFMENGAFYLAHVGGILEYKNRIYGRIGIHELPDSHALELDEVSDWAEAEMLLQKDRLQDLWPQGPVKLFLSDVDGVLTDAGMYYTESGDELKKFNTYDGVAFESVRAMNVPTGFVTTEDRDLNRRRAEKLNITHYFAGEKNKLDRISELCQKLEIDLKNVAYVGDDISDIQLLKQVGFKACPSSAQDAVKSIPGIYILNAAGGTGAVREWVSVLEKSGRLRC